VIESDHNDVRQISVYGGSEPLGVIFDKNNGEATLLTIERLTPGWEFGCQILKPSTRIYFDVGDDDPGEIDLFKKRKTWRDCFRFSIFLYGLQFL